MAQLLVDLSQNELENLKALVHVLQGRTDLEIGVADWYDPQLAQLLIVAPRGVAKQGLLWSDEISVQLRPDNQDLLDRLLTAVGITTGASAAHTSKSWRAHRIGSLVIAISVAAGLALVIGRLTGDYALFAIPAVGAALIAYFNYMTDLGDWRVAVAARKADRAMSKAIDNTYGRTPAELEILLDLGRQAKEVPLDATIEGGLLADRIANELLRLIAVRNQHQTDRNRPTPMFGIMGQ